MKVSKEGYFVRYWENKDTEVVYPYIVKIGNNEATVHKIELIKPKEMDRKVIGYKAPYDLFLGKIKKGTLFTRDINISRASSAPGFYHPENFIRDSDTYLPSEIVETWEPVYEKEKISIGGYDLIFTYLTSSIEKTTSIDGHVFTKQFWEAAKIISEHSKAKVMVGCSKQFDVDLEKINKILDKLK